MGLMWMSTIAANVVLFATMLCYRTWRRFPIFFGQQALCLGLTIVLIRGWYSPSVSMIDYHNAWIASDQLCILGETFAGWEILGRCWMNKLSCILSILLFVHAMLSLTEYSYLEDAMFNHHISVIRQILNLIITFALPIMVYAERKETCNELR